MRTATYQIFDQIISGTTTTWYSMSEFDRLMGQADFYAYQAYPTNVPSVQTQLSVWQEYSLDSQNWFRLPTSDISLKPLSNNVAVAGGNVAFYTPSAFIRMAIWLSGTTPTPSCRLKLYFTGRARSHK